MGSFETGEDLADVKEVRKDQWWRRMLRRMFSNAQGNSAAEGSPGSEATKN